MTILKEEINATQATIIDLAKWKLASVGILCASGLGLLREVQQIPRGYLLLFLVPYACAYIDFLVYERVASVHLIARFLRDYSGSDKDCQELSAYERFLWDSDASSAYRGYDRIARIGSSLIFGLGAPILAYVIQPYRATLWNHPTLFLIPAVGVIWVIAGHVLHKKQIDKLVRKPAQEAPNQKRTAR
jgi:hypothetical protein